MFANEEKKNSPPTLVNIKPTPTFPQPASMAMPIKWHRFRCYIIPK